MNALRAILIVGVTSICLACQHNSSDTPESQSSEDVDALDNYLTRCSDLRFWWGYIQGVQDRDSAGIFTFAECYDSTESYRLIFVPRHHLLRQNRMNDEIVEGAFHEGKNNSFRDFNIYCFVLPLADPDKSCDKGKSNIDYPVDIIVMKRFGTKWTKLGTFAASNMEDFGQIQLHTIFYR